MLAMQAAGLAYDAVARSPIDAALLSHPAIGQQQLRRGSGVERRASSVEGAGGPSTPSSAPAFGSCRACENCVGPTKTDPGPRWTGGTTPSPKLFPHTHPSQRRCRTSAKVRRQVAHPAATATSLVSAAPARAWPHAPARLAGAPHCLGEVRVDNLKRSLGAIFLRCRLRRGAACCGHCCSPCHWRAHPPVQEARNPLKIARGISLAARRCRRASRRSLLTRGRNTAHMQPQWKRRLVSHTPPARGAELAVSNRVMQSPATVLD
jgi:hypothetical protein